MYFIVSHNGLDLRKVVPRILSVMPVHEISLLSGISSSMVNHRRKLVAILNWRDILHIESTQGECCQAMHRASNQCNYNAQTRAAQSGTRKRKLTDS